MYVVKLTHGAQRDLAKAPSQNHDRLVDAMTQLASEPRPHGVVKLGGTLYRIRVGRWRIISHIADRQREAVVVKIAHRSESTYKGL